jgi:GH25 family lysozyme M1 (1,4-beta-N-acetylmuramidase)
MSDPIFVDLSHWNPMPDWAKLLAGGVTGVILKATEGTTYIDPTWRDRALDAMLAGLAVGTYHFLKAGNPAGQMNFYIAETNKVMPLGSRVCIDHEEQATLAELEQAVQRIRDQRPDLQVTVYSGHLIKEQLGSVRSAILAENTSLWIAQYTTAAAPSWPKSTWPAWSLWQYTDKAKVAGTSQPVDGNRFNGSDCNALKWLQPVVEPGPDPEPEPEPEPKPDYGGRVTVSISVPYGTEVTVFVNGKAVG